MISNAVTGITRRCSSVPCSRSRISAEPVRMIASIVMLLMSSITDPNHDCVRFGLKRLRSTICTGAAVPPFRVRNEEISRWMICWIYPLPVNACDMRVASTFS